MNKKLFPVFLIVLVDIFGLMLILPLLPLYAEKMGATPFTASLLFTAYAGCQLLASPILGQLSDRVGRKPVLIVSQVGTLIGFIILAGAHSLPMVFLSRILDGLTAGNISVAHAYVSDVSEPHQRARAFGWIGVAFATGFVIGPALSGFLASHGAHGPIYAAILASAISIVATATLLPGKSPTAPQKDPDESGKEASLLNFASFGAAFRNPPLARLLTQFILFSLAFSGFFTGFPLYAERRYFYQGVAVHVREIGFALTVMGLSALPTQLFILPRALARFSEKKLVAFGYAGTTLGFLLLAIPNLIALGTALVVLGICSSLLRPSLISLITHQAGRNEQGMIMGLIQSLLSICQMVSPLYGGWLIGAGWLTVWPLLGAGFTLAGWAVGNNKKAFVEEK